MKYQVESLDGLDDGLKPFYEAGESGFTLNIEKYTDHKVSSSTNGLAAKVDELLSEKKSEQEKRRLAEDKAAREAEELARKNGDIDALEKSWKEKHETALSQSKGEVDELRTSINNLLVDKVSATLSAQFISPAVVEPHIKSRLAVDTKDGKPRTIVVDREGKPSAMTLEELVDSFKNDDAFKPLVKATEASGGGASNAGSGGDGANGKNLSTKERIAQRKQLRGKS